MALMYDMETVNRAMTEAAKLYDPKHKSAKRVKKVLNIFAGMKPVKTISPGVAHWERNYPKITNRAPWRCSACRLEVSTDERRTLPTMAYCPGCGAIMAGRAEK